jgi:phage shock protein A
MTGKAMTTESADNLEETAKSVIHDGSRQHWRLPDMSGRPSAILVDRTIALILGAIGSAAIAAAFAGGTALIGKVAETAEELEKGRTERSQQYGNITKDMSIIETKVSQLSVQMTQMETRMEKMIEHDFQNRDKRMDELSAEITRLREKITDMPREDTYTRTKK